MNIPSLTPRRTPVRSSARAVTAAAVGSVLFAAAGCQAKPEVARPVDAAAYRPETFENDERHAAILLAARRIDAVFRDHAEAHHHVGHAWGVVTEHGLVHHGTYGVANFDTNPPITPSTRFHIASLTKSFTCLAILKLRDEGKLSLSDPVTRFLPELGATPPLTRDAAPVRIEQLMTMTSGLPEDNPWADRQLDDTDEELLALLRGGLSFSTVPGTAYEYSNLGYAMLGQVIARASGRPYQEYVTDELLHPLGMHDTVWDYGEVPADQLAVGYRWEDGDWKREPMLHTGAFASIGGLLTTLEDFSRYVAFHLNAWPARDPGDTGPVRRSSVRAMHVAQRPRLDATAVDASGAPCPALVGYGHGLKLQTDCHGVLRASHTGGLPGFGTNVHFYPHHGIGLISFANLTYARSSAQMEAATAALFEGGKIRTRTLPAHGKLKQRAREVAELVQSWDDALAGRIVADNLYLDRSLARRRAETEAIFAEVGDVVAVGEVQPLNQLRGSFRMRCERGDVDVSFTMSPERPPKVQRIRLRIVR